MSIGFLGAGRMAQALARGFIAAENFIENNCYQDILVPKLRSGGIVQPDKIIASSPPTDTVYIDEISKLGCQTTYDNTKVVQCSEIVILAVKPPIVPKVLAEVAPVIQSSHLMVSIALGIPLRNLEQMLPRRTRVVRVMPNTPCLIREGCSVFSCGTSTKAGDNQTVKKLLSSVGMCEEVSEALIDPATGLSGSGPAYIYIAIEALADGGVKQGIPRDLAYKLAAQMLIGAARMVLETGRHPGALKDDVCSPAGSSIHAIYHLEKSGLRATLMEAVEAATMRSRQTGKKE
ncbi:Pyrroline-5-carboxylate reductase 1, mitochondrial [Nymphon striatum]|nr:Pyrroline-5-carboxylate reductase 1, mitochondrial [Nymphon striatum]